MPLFAQVGPPPNPIRLLAPVHQRAEAELIRAAVETIHPGVTLYLSKGGLVNRGKELDREANFAGDTATWYRAVARYLAVLRDGDTVVEWPEAVQKWRRENPTHLPFRIVLQGKRAMVTHASEESGVAAGDELLEIEGRRADDIRRAIAEWTSIDGRNDFAKNVKFFDDPHLSGSGLDNFGPILWGLRTTWTTKFRKAGVKQLKGIPFEAWQALSPPKAMKDGLIFERRGGQVAILRVQPFVLDPKEDPMEALRPSFAQLQREPGTRLVLDLRRFRYGPDETSVALVRYLSPQPTAWASEVWTKTTSIPELLRPRLTRADARVEEPGANQSERREDGTQRLLPEAWPDLWKAKESPPERYAGPLDVLVGPETGQGATTLLARLRGIRPLRVIGERTAGTAEGSSGGAFWSLRLPHSRLVVRLPIYRLETGVKEKRGIGIVPDVRMGPTREDREGKTDSVLDWTLDNPAKPK